MAKRSRPRPSVPKAGPVTITHADGSSEQRSALSPMLGTNVVKAAQKRRAKERDDEAQEAWRRATT